MLIVHFNLKHGEDDYGVIENFTVYGTCADDDDAIIAALIHCLDEMGSDDACAVAYERYDGTYSSNPEDYENTSYAVVSCEWDTIRNRHVWWWDEDIHGDMQLW